MRVRSAATATHVEAAVASAATLEAQGGAVDAVVAGYFTLAGELASGLLSPAYLLVAGAGAGARAFDGRALQPGVAASRPRGVLGGEVPPPVARTAVPRAPQMVLLAHARFGRRPLRDVAKPGVVSAKARGAPRRAALIDRIGEGGAEPLRREDVSRALLRVAGLNAGGLLTAEDLAEATPSEEPARVLAPRGEAAGGGIDASLVVAPWPHVLDDQGRGVHVICAVDGWGLSAALVCLDLPEQEGRMVEELEIALPGVAIPVLRGKTRAPPRTVLPMRVRDAALLEGGPALRVAACLGPSAPEDDGSRAEALRRAPVDAALRALGASVAAVAEPGGARLWRSA